MKTTEEGREKQDVTASLTAAKYCRLARVLQFLVVVFI